jgi:hypothetical protein
MLKNENQLHIILVTYVHLLKNRFFVNSLLALIKVLFLVKVLNI